MKNSYIIFFLIFSSTLTIARCYTIDGKWQLEENSIYKDIDPSTYIVFDFQKVIEEGKIKNIVAIQGCSILYYSFEVNENQILMTFQESAPNKKTCYSDQFSEIRRFMDKVAYTTIIEDRLILLSPSGKTLFKLKKIRQRSLLTSINGAFNIFEVKDEPTSKYAQANSTQLQICQGNAVIDYKILKENQIKFSIKQVKGCNENSLLSEIYRTRYVRRYGLRQLYFYDDRGIVMKWSKLANIGNSEDLFPPLPVSETAKSPSISLSVETQKPTIAASPAQQAPPQEIRKQTNSSEVKSEITQVVVKSGQQSLQVPTKADSKVQQQIAAPKPDTSPKSQQKNYSKSYKVPIVMADITTKWYPTDDPENGQNKYSMVVLNNRILITACSTMYSLLEYHGGEDGKLYLTKMEPKSVDPSCEQANKGLKGMLEELVYVTAIEKDSQKILTIWNKNNEKIGVLSNKAK